MSRFVTSLAALALLTVAGCGTRSPSAPERAAKSESGAIEAGWAEPSSAASAPIDTRFGSQAPLESIAEPMAVSDPPASWEPELRLETFPNNSVESRAPQMVGEPSQIGRLPEGNEPQEVGRVAGNAFLAPATHPFSTFSIDVDTASYSNLRKHLEGGTLPPLSEVRIEELVNYFRYAYPEPQGKVPFSVQVDVAGCPWTPQNRLVRIGLRGREIPFDRRPPSNLVFLLDVSGSMDAPNKLPLVKDALALLVGQLRASDRVAIVVYASRSGLHLPSTPGNRKSEILAAIERLRAEGSTNGGEGIRLAYETALANFVEGGTNRVVLCTDGDFNVGVTDPRELVALVREKSKSRVFLSVLGFGTGNYQDERMEMLADQGNGWNAYIDDQREARKVFLEQASGTLVAIAKEVKIQVDFNPAQVAGYRLVGYENRRLRDEDFQDDRKDAGEIGAGHTVTAFYEIVPVRSRHVEPSRYRQIRASVPASVVDELLAVRLRWKDPDQDESRRIDVTLKDSGTSFDDAPSDFRFAAAVAEFGLLLRNSPHKGQANWPHVIEVAGADVGPDPQGHRKEFISLAKRAAALRPHAGAPLYGHQEVIVEPNVSVLLDVRP